MLSLMEERENQHFGEALLFILNEQGKHEEKNRPLLKQILNALQDLFSGEFLFLLLFCYCLFAMCYMLFAICYLNYHSFLLIRYANGFTSSLFFFLFPPFLDTIDDVSSSYFVTNDLKVLVDIFIREITNLNQKEQLRADYLQTLSLLLNQSSWVEHGRYRRTDIVQCLESILDVGGDGVDGFLESVVEMVEIVFVECQNILEE